MKAVLFSLGTRGDIEPFLALAEMLRDKNWEVICAFPEQFRETVETEGYPFYGFNKAFLEVLIQSETGSDFTGRKGSVFKRAGTLFSLARSALKITKEILTQQREITQQEQPDYIFYHQKCIYPVIWGMENIGKSVLISPYPCLLHKVKDHSLIGFGGGGNYGRVLNTLSYFIPNIVRAIIIHTSTKRYHREFKVKINPFRVFRAMLQREKSFYTISPTLFPKPGYWHDNVNVVGFYERSETKNRQPEEALTGFLEKHDKIVFISFGSISSPKVQEKTGYIIKILARHKIPAIINTAWGGLSKPGEYPDHIHFVQNIPYQWIFPKVYAVIHHGGSGTTHMALKYGCANMIIPHFIDQFFWNRTIAKIGAGPKGFSIKKLAEKNFEIKLLDLLNNRSYKEKAGRIASRMKQEIQTEKLFELILK